MIQKAIIPAAGLGTRLLPATKEQPKEMLPIFTRSLNGQLCLKPLLQLVFEKLYDVGFRQFCFIVGRGKRSIEDHFSVDNNFIEHLKDNNKFQLANELDGFYQKLRSSSIVFVNQPQPRGFGDAVYQAKPFTDKEAFLVHAGDDLIISRNNDHLMRLISIFERYEADVAFFVEKVKDPSRYGVIVGEKIGKKVYQVKKIVEKPPFPPSNIATVAVYAFNPKIYQAIEATRPDENDEIQLTDAIQQLIDQKCDVFALQLNENEKRIDIGNPKSYWMALNASRNFRI